MSKVDEIMALAQEYGIYYSAWDRLPNKGRKSALDEKSQELRNAIEALAQPAGEAEPTEGDLLDAFNRGESVADGLAEVAALFTTKQPAVSVDQDGMQPIDVLASIWNAMQNSADGDDLLNKLEHMRDSIERAVQGDQQQALQELADDAQKLYGGYTAQPAGEAEPVAEVVWYDPTPIALSDRRSGKIIDASMAFFDNHPVGTKLYTTPQQSQPLTDEYLRKLHHEDQFGLFCDYEEFEQIARAIEAAHGIKKGVTE